MAGLSSTACHPGKLESVACRKLARGTGRPVAAAALADEIFQERAFDATPEPAPAAHRRGDRSFRGPKHSARSCTTIQAGVLPMWPLPRPIAGMKRAQPRPGNHRH